MQDTEKAFVKAHTILKWLDEIARGHGGYYHFELFSDGSGTLVIDPVFWNSLSDTHIGYLQNMMGSARWSDREGGDVTLATCGGLLR